MSDEIAVVLIVVLAAALLLLVWQRLRAGAVVGLRPLEAYSSLREQAGWSAESGRRLHVTTGRGPLYSLAGPTSAAGLKVLSYLADESSGAAMLPRTTVGEATLFPAAQGSLRRAYTIGGHPSRPEASDVQFIAASDFPMAYAAGVTAVIEGEEVSNNVAVGRYGPELALIAEAARRGELDQVLGTDDPTAMALATLYTGRVLWGEELFVSSAYLDGEPLQVASVRAEDILRWLLVGAILISTVLTITGLI